MKHEYPDGSARYGSPPFPKLSPMEVAAGKKESAGEVDPVMPDPASIVGFGSTPGKDIPKTRGRPKKVN